MKARIGIMSIALFFMAVTGTSAQDKLSGLLDEYLQSASQHQQFNGTALIAKGDKIILEKGYGWKNAADHKMNTVGTIYQIGSMTKPFTSEMILLLSAQGKLSVSDHVSKYLPDFPNGEQITLENLLTHTSGVPTYNVDETDTVAWTPISRKEMLALFRDKPLDFEPGSQYNYSNSGYFLLGLIVERITGTSYEQAVRNMIFKPLHMDHSGFDYMNLKDTARATGYAELNQSAQRPAHLIDSTVSFAAGEMYSNVSDLLRWARSVAKHQMLPAGLWKKAQTPLMGNYGYGWIADKINGEPYVGHGGGIMGFTSTMVYFPKKDVTIILLTNIFNERNPAALPVQDLSAIVFHKPFEMPAAVVEVPDTLLGQYAGTYELTSNPARKMVIRKEKNHLTATATGAPALELRFQTKAKFTFRNVANVTGEFLRENGVLTKLIVLQNGRYEWKKIK